MTERLIREAGKKFLNFRHGLAGCVNSAPLSLGLNPLKDAIRGIMQFLIRVFVHLISLFEILLKKLVRATAFSNAAFKPFLPGCLNCLPIFIYGAENGVAVVTVKAKKSSRVSLEIPTSNVTSPSTALMEIIWLM